MKSRVYFIFVILAALLAAYCAYFAYLPFQDLPNLLYQGIAFGNIVFHGNSMDGYYSLTPYIPPNTISTVILALLHEVFSPIVSAKMYVFLLGCFLYSGIYRFLRFHCELSELSIGIIAFIFTLNMHFLSGYLNFVTGLAYSLHVIVFLRKRNGQMSIPALMLAILLAYLCHFFALVIFGLYVTMYFISSAQPKSIIRLAAAAIPALVVGIHYLVMRTVVPVVPLAGGVTFTETLGWKSFVYLAPTIPFHQFKWVTDIPAPLQWINMVSSAALVLVAAYALYRSVRLKIYSLSAILFVVFSVVVIALPANLGGNLMPGERLSVMTMLFAVMLISEQIHLGRLTKYLKTIGVLTCILIAIHITYNTSRFQAMVTSGDMPFDAIHNPHFKREGTNGFIHFHIYNAIEVNKAVPLFNTGLVLSKGAEPITQ